MEQRPRSGPIHRLLKILVAPATGPSEVILTLTMIAYGLGLLLPRDEFAIYHSRGEMATTWSDTTWGIMFALVGGSRLMTILWESYHARIGLTMISIGLWLYLAISFLSASPLNPRVFVLLVWTLCECWTLFRIRHRG